MAASTNTAAELDAGATSGGFHLSDLNATILTKFFLVLEAVAILVVTIFLVRLIRSKFEKLEATHEQQRTAINLLEKISTGFLIVIGITIALKTVGIDMSLLVSVALLGLSYGLKDVIKNYVAGILIFFKAPFKIGDVVKIKKYIGKVEKMDLQSTTLKTFDYRDITIYNSDVMSQSIANYSRYPMRRMEVDVRLGYGSNLEKATRLFEELLKSEPAVLKNPRHNIVFKKFSDSGTIVQLKFWVAMPCNMLKIRSSIALKIHELVDEQNLLMPYTKDVQYENDVYMTPERKARLETSYKQPIFANIENPPSPEELVPDAIDIDEPPFDEMEEEV